MWAIFFILTTKFTYKTYYSVAAIPISWDALSVKNSFLKRDYLQALELASPTNMACHYIGLFQENELVGIAISQFIDLSKVSSFGERDHCVKTAIRDFAFKKFSSKVLLIGNNMLTGQHAFCFSPDLPYSVGLELLKNAISSIEKEYSKKKTRIHLTIFKDFSANEVPNFAIPAFHSFFNFTTQPNMLFIIKENWKNFDDYVLDLNKKYRDQFKRARKKSEGITKRKLTVNELIHYKNRIHELYMNVAKNAPFNTFYLPENHFETFKMALKDEFLFYGYFNGETLIGFNTLVKNGSDIDTYFLGYDEKYQREKMLYLNMLYDMIGYSINKGYSRIVFARTALEIKSSVGAKPIEMHGFIKHSNWFINLFISKLFRYFEPEMTWIERNPFK